MTRSLADDATSRAARHVKPAREQRRFTVRDVEMRATPDGTGTERLQLTGYASTFDEPYTVTDWMGDYTEVIKSGAFTRTLNNGDDVRLLLNHDGLPLARWRGLGHERNSMALTEDSTGLLVEAELDPRSSLVTDIASAMERGDLDQMSFAFQVVRQMWHGDWPDEQRDILEVKLFDVSVVTYPANPGTSVSLGERMKRVSSALREKRALSDEDDVAMLTEALGWLASIDEIVDDGQMQLSEYLGVDNPDDEDEGRAAMQALVERLSARRKRSAAAAPASGGSPITSAKQRLLDLPVPARI